MSERQQLINSHKSLDSTNDGTSSASYYGTKLQDHDESEFQATTEHRERLDKILLDFGLGKFQYSLFLLCGFGWLTENMWLQAVIVLLPRIQRHYSISDVNIGLPNSALFFGMMLGSLFWGGHSDIHGRRDAFHWTLATASIAGILSGLTPGFWFLIAFLVAVGFGVGGTVPVDNSIILEFLPSKYHYLVTSLSVFFNLGAVLASLFAFLILPSYSCPDFTSDKLYLPCDVDLQNNGWRYVFITLSVLNGFLAFSRVFLFKLPESPQFLLAKNQPSKVVDTLNSIAKFNGLSKVFTIDDIVNVDKKATLLKADADISVFSEDPDSDIESGDAQIKNTKSKPKFEIVESHVKTHWLLKALGFDFNLIYNLFQPYYRMSTILLWIIWVFMALAYNLFTIFLPRYLEMKGQDDGVNNMSDVYWRYLIFSLSGIPGSLVGSWLVDTKLGRKGTLALSILFSGLAQVGFIFFKNLNLVTFCSSSVSFLVTLMYAVLYCYTPEVFDPRLRSTACGIASSLSRLLAIISPMLTGVLFSIRAWAPLEISTVLLFILVILTVMLPYETKDKSVE